MMLFSLSLIASFTGLSLATYLKVLGSAALPSYGTTNSSSVAYPASSICFTVTTITATLNNTASGRPLTTEIVATLPCGQPTIEPYIILSAAMQTAVETAPVQAGGHYRPQYIILTPATASTQAPQPPPTPPSPKISVTSLLKEVASTPSGEAPAGTTSPTGNTGGQQSPGPAQGQSQQGQSPGQSPGKSPGQSPGQSPGESPGKSSGQSDYSPGQSSPGQSSPGQPSAGQSPQVQSFTSTFSRDSSAGFVIGTQTLSPGSAVTVNGAVVSLPPSASGLVVAGQTLLPGSAVTVNGETISLAPSGSAIVVNGVTTSTPSPTGVLTFGSATVPFVLQTGPSTTQIVIGSETLTPGGVITTAGETISLAPGGSGVVIVSGSSTTTEKISATYVPPKATSTSGSTSQPTAGSPQQWTGAGPRTTVSFLPWALQFLAALTFLLVL